MQQSSAQFRFSNSSTESSNRLKFDDDMDLPKGRVIDGMITQRIIPNNWHFTQLFHMDIHTAHNVKKKYLQI